MAGRRKGNHREQAEDRWPKTVEQIAIEERHRLDSQKAEEPDAESEGKKKRNRSYNPSIFLRTFAWIAGIAAAVILGYGFAHTFCRGIEMNESSMEPTISVGQKLLINSAYDSGDVKRGDIIVFETGREGDASLHVKRVIGLPGETVQISNGQILINGETYLEGDYPSILDAGIASEPILLDSDEYFVLGDNRNGSEDSRHASIGNVEADEIVGKIWFSIEPFGSI